MSNILEHSKNAFSKELFSFSRVAPTQKYIMHAKEKAASEVAPSAHSAMSVQSKDHK
jgi:hypothetical protein